MKNINSKRAMSLLLVLAFIISLVNYWIEKDQINYLFFFDCLNYSIMGATFASIVFCRYIWKSRLFKGWLVKVPDLNGTWKGLIISDWVDPKTGISVPHINASLIVKQSLFNISCIMKTKEMTSQSLVSGFSIDNENQVLKLSYTYLSIPLQNIQDQSRIHHGTVIFDIDNSSEILKMKGNYWTGRKTSGTIELELFVVD